MKKMKYLVRPISAVLLTVWLAPAFAESREVICESSHSNRAYCPTGRHGDVRLLKQIGWSSCQEGQSWGVETEGIWVDRGCRAKFWVDEEGHGKKNHTGAIIAGVAGAALIGALLLSRSGSSSDSAKSAEQSENIAGALAGSYEGYDQHENLDLEVQIQANGHVVANAGHHRSEGQYENGHIRFAGGHEYRVEKTHRGVRLFNTHDKSNVVDMTKI